MEIIFLDEEPLKEKIPLRSLLYGEGVFETFRWKGSPPVYLDKHIDRMKMGSEFLAIPFPGKRSIKTAVEEAIKISKIADAYVKVCLLSSGGMKFHERPKEGHVLVIARRYEPQKENMRAHVVQLRRTSSSPLLRIKSVNYLENVLARREAMEKGCDEAIFLNERGEVAEGSSTNIFWVKKGTLYTPAAGCGLLPGITREALISLAPRVGLEVEEGRFRLNSVLSSDAAFLTNSLIGISAISSIDGAKIPFDTKLFTELRSGLFKKLGWVH
jgi:4-amino-4-deoxychorismate lyase